MKSFNLLVLAAALFIALPASAQQVKPYHQNIKDCAACHSEHKTSQVYCNNCHEFKYQIK